MDQKELQERLDTSEKPIVIDFWAEWCVPCKRTKPILEKLAVEYKDKVNFLQVDTDQSREVLEKYRVYGIPTLISIRNGKEVGRITGSKSEAGYRSLFQAAADGTKVNMPLSSFDRSLRLGAGGLFVLIGISTSNWFVTGIGVVLAFLGVYDRCPIWNALTRIFKHR